MQDNILKSKPEILQKERAIAILKTINDPELGIDVHTLGLIYNLDVQGKKARIRMTFTSPMCPYGPQSSRNLSTKDFQSQRLK